MIRLLYQLMYGLGRTPWDSGQAPPELREVFSAGGLLPGPVLDLGCGTGTNVIFMAEQGRQAIGIDFVASAIRRARRKARKAGVERRTRFLVGDVTRLEALGLPHCALALDMGCFHGLNDARQQRYVTGLAACLLPGARYLLYTLDPRRQACVSFGLSPEQVQTVFAPWFEIERSERGGFRRSGSTWFWMVRRNEKDPTAG